MGFKNKFICIFDLKDFSSVNPSFAIPTLSLSPWFDFEEKIWNFKEMYSLLSWWDFFVIIFWNDFSSFLKIWDLCYSLKPLMSFFFVIVVQHF